MNTGVNWDCVKRLYYENGVTYVDNLLDAGDVESLRSFALTVDYRHAFYWGYSAFHFSREGVRPQAFDKIVSNLEHSLDLIFTRGWFFIYDSRSEGVKIHVDPSSDTTVNIWVTPEDCMIGGVGFNGLDIWKIKPKPEWGYDISNGDTQICEEYIQETNPELVNIDYKYNRASIFDSDYFHQSHPVWTRDGHFNRRVNYSLLFDKKTKLG